MLLMNSSLVNVSATFSRISGSEIRTGNIRGTWGSTPETYHSAYMCFLIDITKFTFEESQSHGEKQSPGADLILGD